MATVEEDSQAGGGNHGCNECFVELYDVSVFGAGDWGDRMSSRYHYQFGHETRSRQDKWCRRSYNVNRYSKKMSDSFTQILYLRPDP
jgi:hypothetical protein